jgi:cyclic pyranopterin phosphate synthase
MVDVSDKVSTAREAIAEGFVSMAPETLTLALSGQGKNGAVIPVAEIAGVMAAKQTASLIPLCHPLSLSKIDVAVTEGEGGLKVTAIAKTTGPTGVEMEALAAVAGGLLTVYDMLKAVDRGMTIANVRLVKKSGGKSGTFVAT